MSGPLNFPCRVMGHAVVLIGGFMMFGGLLGGLDPGIKQADDADPFGIPPSSTEIWGLLFAGLVLVVVGRWLVTRRPRTGR